MSKKEKLVEARRTLRRNINVALKNDDTVKANAFARAHDRVGQVIMRTLQREVKFMFQKVM